MNAKIVLAGLVLLTSISARADAAEDAALAAAAAGPQRTPAFVARDVYRHPVAELEFFGLRADMVVVELWPGGGWWTEILAPYLSDRGTYYVAQPDASALAENERGGLARFAAKLAANPTFYGKVKVSTFQADKFPIVPDVSADLELTFRNLHNWMADGTVDASLRAIFNALKPGGVLGLEDHRGNPDLAQDPLAKSGYVRQDYAIALAEKAGFKFVGSSEINANPRDTKDYPAGVWTLPPTYRLGDQDRAKYQAIGEGDCFVLKFVKPQ